MTEFSKLGLAASTQNYCFAASAGVGFFSSVNWCLEIDMGYCRLSTDRMRTQFSLRLERQEPKPLSLARRGSAGSTREVGRSISEVFLSSWRWRIS